MASRQSNLVAWNITESRETTVYKQPLSKESGVPLDAPADFKATPIRIADSLNTVRQCMRVLRGAAGKWQGGEWERRDNGYYLVPVPIPANPPQQSDGKEKAAK